MVRKPRTSKAILSGRRATFRSQPIAADGKTTFVAESLGERNAIHCLRVLADVRIVSCQKLSFHFYYDGRECTYTPDIYAERLPLDDDGVVA